MALLLLVSAVGVLISAAYKLSLDHPAIIFASETPEEGSPLRAVVYISGAVALPGVYDLNQGMRLYELIDRAGGLAPNVDVEFIAVEANMAEVLSDEQHIYIPFLKEAESASVADSSEVEGSKVSLNSGTQAELESLPGVGSSLAQRIINARPFTSIGQLDDVEGIGEKTFANLEPLVGL